jgi:3-hydroxy-5-methyl-1-naphthoate 3-O-methyltransferase
MTAFKHHILVCTQDKSDGLPSCVACGGKALLEAFRARLQTAGLGEQVLLTGCGCLGLCERGPNVLIYPQGRWLTQVKLEQVDAIVQDSLLGEAAGQARPDPDDATIRSEVLAHRAKLQAITAARARAGVLPDELMALVRGYMPSRAILTAVELNVFSVIGEGASAMHVAERIDCDVRATASLLNSLVSLGLLSRAAEEFRNTELSATFLRAGAPHDSRAALMHSVHLWQSWSTLTDCVRTGTRVASRSGVGADDWTEAFIAAMHKNASLRAPVVVAALDLGRVDRVLDLGGGSGAYSIAIARAKPTVRCTVFDLPGVLPLAKRYVQQASLTDRIELVAGDMHSDIYGSGFDLALVSAICHMNSPSQNVSMLSKLAQALRPGASVVIQDYLLNDDGTGHSSATLFSLNMLVGTESGSSYRTKDYFDWLGQAGFEAARRVTLAGPTGLVVATRK